METLIALLIFIVIAIVLLWLADQAAGSLGAYAKPLKLVLVALLLVVFIVRFLAPYLRAG